jgi:thiamine-monophosphate kinase
MQLGAFAVGVIPDGRPVTRVGCGAGDVLFASGRLGLGGAYALASLAGEDAAKEGTYRPMARIREGKILRPFATCCMDTSDGVLPALDQLARLNAVGFRIDTPLEGVLHPVVLASATASGIPLWMYLAGPHGEFELVFTVPAGRLGGFTAAAAAAGWEPVRLGVVSAEPVVAIPIGGVITPVDTGRVRNLFTEVGGDVSRYIRALFELNAALKAVSPSPVPAQSPGIPPSPAAR